MTAKEAQELAEKITSLPEHEIGVLLLELDIAAWKRGYEQASKIIVETIKKS